MEHLYRDDDWTDLASAESGYLNLHGQSVPYVVFPKEDDVSTGNQTNWRRVWNQCRVNPGNYIGRNDHPTFNI